MKIFLPAIFGLLVACGSSPETGEGSETKDDSAMNNTSVGDTTAAAAINELTDAEKGEGWQLLFDGKSKAGWHGYLQGNDSAWKVSDSALFLEVTPNEKRTGVDIVTDNEYENFHLKVDWKISEGGNSGIMFGVKESQEFKNTYFTGPEMQVLDNEKHSDAKINKHRAGDLYDLVSSSVETVKPVGEWNTAEIIIKDSTLELKLNGPTVVKTKLWDENWKKLVMGSKFVSWPAFGTFKSGRIALQDHGDKVWFRNIKIRKL
jgi:hypothetical protein